MLSRRIKYRKLSRLTGAWSIDHLAALTDTVKWQRHRTIDDIGYLRLFYHERRTSSKMKRTTDRQTDRQNSCTVKGISGRHNQEEKA